MDAKLVANYISTLKTKTGLTYEAIAAKSERSESTVKNLCNGKSEDPRLDTVAPIVYALGGSIDEMLNPGKSKDEILCCLKLAGLALAKEILKEFIFYRIACMEGLLGVPLSCKNEFFLILYRFDYDDPNLFVRSE